MSSNKFKHKCEEERLVKNFNDFLSGVQLFDRLHDLQIDYYWCVPKREITFAKNFFFNFFLDWNEPQMNSITNSFSRA